MTLLLPGLLGPQPLYRQLPAADKPDLRTLEAWLSRAEQTASPVHDPWAGLFTLFGLNSDATDAMPVAAVTAAFDGLDARQGWWLRADPVYLQPDRHQAVLLASEALALQPEESHALVENLNAHFAADGWQIQAPHPQRWYIQLPHTEQIHTTPLPHVMGQGINQHLPQGEHRQQWHCRLNEIQMLLHQHPLNHQRMQAGKLPVNSLWLWGEGALPTLASGSFDVVYGDDILLEALAQLTQTHHAPLAAFEPDGVKGRCLLLDDACYASVLTRDVFAWLASVAQIQNAYLSPLQARLKQQVVSTVTLLPANGQQYRLTRRRRPRWWHKRHSLETFLSR